MRHYLLLVAVATVATVSTAPADEAEDDRQTTMMKKDLVETTTQMMKKSLEQQRQKTSSVNDGGRLLSLPNAESCKNRPKHFELNGHWYFLSSNTTEHKDAKNDWLDSRNLCRKYCMDAVSIETEEENEIVFNLVKKERLPYIWTSGRLCNFKGCEDREDLRPLEVLGWFWSASGVKVSPTNKKPEGWENQPWSQTGHFKRPQPDNAEFEINETTEACLAVLNNVYKDGIAWHDIGCYHTKAVLCEDNDQLLKYIAATNRGIIL
ncbi:uncharacterized protein LOC136031838 [Artemia franciscana]|nr:hypothetical protein QYM36_000034 [Artemia franciscana]KAK2725392.1 hypothetical protein QYM36_000034 [Artemia franciscana]KAK2725395.1 hypothetical protein QYM36_000034 [Artemia franciscana]KAK2725396.1 hypothetical protein QYM36_000034 [Artemia franciscana]